MTARGRGRGVTGRSVVVCGAMSRRAGLGGHAWALLQWVLGFRRLWFGITFLDWVDDGREAVRGAHYTSRVADAFGLRRDFAVLTRGGDSVAGLRRTSVLARVRRSSLLLNVMGYLDDEQLLEAADCRVFLDIDPGYGQMWSELGLAQMFRGHDAYVTVAQNLGASDCGIPSCGLTWLTTLPPVVLDHWPVSAAAGSAFTSVITWRGPYGPVEYAGKTYGSRVHEFRRFATLPGLTATPFELALDIDPAEQRDLRLLRENGWRLVDPRAVVADPHAYRRYIQGSAGELSIAKGMYVRTRSGWISDRTACYLASGKPVVAQDTGFERALPTGEGLVSFATLDQAAEAVAEVERNRARHARAARALAQEYLDSNRVLRRLVDEVGVA